MPAADTVESNALAEYQKTKQQWDAKIKEVADLQATLAGSPPADQPALLNKYSKLVDEVGAMIPGLQAAAERAYAADPSNQEIGDLLYKIAVAHLRSDRYDDTLKVADFLIAHKYPQKEVYRVAASAAFATMHLAEAKKDLEALGGGKVPDDAASKQLADEIARYEPLWENEQKIRAAEVKADDLPRVKLHTSQGDIVLELFENEAPNTVANFISLVEKGFYNGTQFHRVLPNFMAQGGDPLSKDPAKNKGRIGSGGPGYTIACECYQPNRRSHFQGSLSMAHAGRDTGGSQFFLTFAPTPFLDGKHTVFGRVIEGMDVLPKLQRVDPEVENECIPRASSPTSSFLPKCSANATTPTNPKPLPKNKVPTASVASLRRLLCLLLSAFCIRPLRPSPPPPPPRASSNANRARGRRSQ